MNTLPEDHTVSQEPEEQPLSIKAVAEVMTSP